MILDTIEKLKQQALSVGNSATLDDFLRVFAAIVIKNCVDAVESVEEKSRIVKAFEIDLL
jgi:hypothetical protein